MPDKEKQAKLKQLAYKPSNQARAILSALPAGTRSDAINQAIIATYGQGKEAAIARLHALLSQAA